MESNGQQVGYIRVSSAGQNTARQLDGIALDRVFEDHVSGKNTDRPAFQDMMRYVRAGDTLHVHSMDRLARNLDNLRATVKTLTDRGVKVVFAKEAITFAGDSSPMSLLMLSVMGAFAEFERALILERQKEGTALAKRKGVYKGRKPELSDQQIAEAREKIAMGVPISKIVRNLTGRTSGKPISRQTLYSALKRAERSANPLEKT